MKKRLLSTVLVLTLLISMLVGCADSAGSGTQSDSQNDADVSQSTVKYDYTQELNIIDDNYRNYYEIFVGSFYDSDGDGMGDLNGVTEKLDYIEEMGFNGIWLMPIMPSPTYHKYDVTDYEEIDEAYGTIEDFKKLVEVMSCARDSSGHRCGNESQLFRASMVYRGMSVSSRSAGGTGAGCRRVSLC